MVTLSMDVRSSQGRIREMRVGDGFVGDFGPFRRFRKVLRYKLPEDAIGQSVIAVQFVDQRGNVSPIYRMPIDIAPDFPVRQRLTRGEIPTVSLRRGNSSFISLPSVIVDPNVPIVRMSTSAGEVLVELLPQAAPLTVENFLNYVDSNAYDFTFFHRSVPNFIIQGGGWLVDTQQNNTIQRVQNFGTVLNEPGISNTRGTIAMAKLPGDPDSATTEWFFNTQNNASILDDQNGGFTVFGNVLESSMPIVDGIAALPISNQSATLGFGELPVFNLPGPFNPLTLDDIVFVNTASRYNFRVLRSVSGVKATIQNNFLVLEPTGRPRGGRGSIQIRAITPDGLILDFPVQVDIGTNLPMLAKGAPVRRVRTRQDRPVNIPIPVNSPVGAHLDWEFLVEPTQGTVELLPQVRPNMRVARYTPDPDGTPSDTFTLRVFLDDEDPQKRGQDILRVDLTITPPNS